jgi:diacylglycerol kinase (ATP)
MQEKGKILFIVNLNSGSSSKLGIVGLIHDVMGKSGVGYHVETTGHVGHAKEIAKHNLKAYKTLVAVGGDGTVNEVSSQLTGLNNLLGMVPLGSGNGLARQLGIPMDPIKAIERVLNGKVVQIDSGTLNGNHFINMSGIGFDAAVAHHFDQLGHRGFWGYFKAVFHVFTTFKATEVAVTTDDGSVNKKMAYLVDFANSCQWGNNFHISPLSLVNDGKLEVCILKKFPKLLAPVLVARLRMGNIHKSAFMESFVFEKIKVQTHLPVHGHVDGEPLVFDNRLQVEVVKGSVNVVV